MTQDICVTCSSECVIYTSVAQVHVTVTTNVTLVAGAVKVTCLGQDGTALILRVTGIGTAQVDCGAVSG